MDSEPKDDDNVLQDAALLFSTMIVGALSGLAFGSADRAFGAFVGFGIGLTFGIYWLLSRH